MNKTYLCNFVENKISYTQAGAHEQAQLKFLAPNTKIIPDDYIKK